MKEFLTNPTTVGILRHVMTLIGTMLATRGLLTQEDATTLVNVTMEIGGSVLILISIIGSVINKKNQNGNANPPSGTGSGPS